MACTSRAIIARLAAMIGNRAKAYAQGMRIPIPLRRLAYRGAHRVLRAYWFVRRPTIHGVKCVLTDRERVLLVRHTYGHRRWDLPGGSLKRGEPPAAAARREMEEELGVTIEHWRELGERPDRVYGRQDTLHCFQAELNRPPLTVDRGELAEVQWFARGELPPDLARWVRPILAWLR